MFLITNCFDEGSIVFVCMTGVKKALTNKDECSIIFVSMLCVFLCVMQPRVKMVHINVRVRH